MNIQRGIEYYYSGPEAETLRASFVQMKQGAARLHAGEHVLYLNTLSSAREVEAVADSISRRHRAKVMTVTLTSTTFAARSQFLGLTVAAKNVRVIVLNSLDFAARTANQKKALVHWLREMRDVLECRVIVYGIGAPVGDGAIGQMKYVTELAVPYSQWNKSATPKNKQIFGNDDVIERMNPSEAARSFIAEIEQSLPVLEEALPVLEEAIEEISELAIEAPDEEPIAEPEFVDEAGVFSRPLQVVVPAMASIKINDLPGAHALRTIEDDELELANWGKVREVVEEVEFA